MKGDSVGEQLFLSTVRIETNLGTGTGFWVSIPAAVGGGNVHLMLVTNKHVVVGAEEARLSLPAQDSEGKLVLGPEHQLKISQFSQGFVGHPTSDVDVAVANASGLPDLLEKEFGRPPWVQHIPLSLFPTSQQISELDALEDVVFIGYPSGLWDAKHNLPIARRGMTATPIAVDFEGTPKFLLDAAVFRGSSGSPVFLWNRGVIPDRRGNITIGGMRLLFLGIVAERIFKKEISRVLVEEKPALLQGVAITEATLNLGVVFKARTVLETIRHYFENGRVDLPPALEAALTDATIV